MVLMILSFSCACVSGIDGANPDVRRSYPWLIYVDVCCGCIWLIINSYFLSTNGSIIESVSPFGDFYIAEHR
jgi:hypothetical protein